MDSYRSLNAWKLAHRAALPAIKATDVAYHPRARDLFHQLRRAAVSVEANIVEGYALNTEPLFRRHLRIAFGSAAEAECLARLVGQVEYLQPAIVKELEDVLGETMRVIKGLMRRPPCTGG
ncbi:MAG: four helix bundle protein [Burkholderiales bacterium]